MPETSHRPSSSGERVAAGGIVAVVVATVLAGVLLPNRAPDGARAVADDPSCLEWSDGCSVCQRLPEGQACSLPGIACEPGPQRCLRPARG
ncbi:hypothetical protein [Methylobacterium aerolatum]|uniref:Uncharacterized protein n=1 Tax=Methylobacterium aerolatum TaxID=418708 RepID=A0ABU0I5P4_9HYPH|nr:hypothetical protein [Methylobacterium aerolatum]MDQ0448991.1 hypothetical protein [Methylobacterium aerolatum]GJD36128.1 hypothetical protein FMGBMHLM_3042 [Methylobacterium aerolatum]